MYWRRFDLRFFLTRNWFWSFFQWGLGITAGVGEIFLELFGEAYGVQD